MTRDMSILLAVAGAAVLHPLSAQPAERIAAPVKVTGIVFIDRNDNGARDPGEAGVPGVSISDQTTVTATDSGGRFTIDAAGYGYVFVTQPDGYAVRGPFWRMTQPDGEIAFALTPVERAREFVFIHASDTHVSEQSVARLRRLAALVDSVRPAFVIISGDLVRDALRVPEEEARRYYELFAREIAAFPVPVYTVPGNHEIFGIERHRSLVAASHPLYGKRMYRVLRGPNYYSFEYGGVHFLGLDTVDYDDLWYFGHVDSLQMRWLAGDVSRLRPDMPVVTFNHIPLVTAAIAIDGYDEESVAPTLIRVNGRRAFRHVVQNAAAVLDLLGSRLDIALGGHMHRREVLRYETPFGTRRFAQTAAVAGPPNGEGPIGIRSGITVYRVREGHVDDGTFVPLDPPIRQDRPARR